MARRSQVPKRLSGSVRLGNISASRLLAEATKQFFLSSNYIKTTNSNHRQLEHQFTRLVTPMRRSRVRSSRF